MKRSQPLFETDSLAVSPAPRFAHEIAGLHPGVPMAPEADRTGVNCLVVMLGRAGAGKTTIMDSIRHDAEAARRPICGVTIAKAAALRLEVEHGLRAARR